MQTMAQSKQRAQPDDKHGPIGRANCKRCPHL